MPQALTRGRGYDQDGEPPCSMDGWLYPTDPPLTKGRKTTALFSKFPSCGHSLILSFPPFPPFCHSERSEESLVQPPNA